MEKVILEYAKRSEHEIEILTLSYDRENTFEGFEDIEVKEIEELDPPDSFLEQAINFGVKPLFRKLDLEDYDVLVVSEAGFGSPITVRNRGIKTLAYVHTPLRAALPEFKKTYREQLAGFIKPLFPLMIFCYNILERISWRNFDQIVANSKLTAERIENKGLRSTEEIDIVHPGADIEGNKGKNYDSYFFLPSRFEPYKRQELALEAFEEADLNEDFELVLAGTTADEEYLQEIKEKAGNRVRIDTDISEERWEDLYSKCYSVLFCAENEDWGIIPIEAGSYSKPVISVDEGGPKDSVIDGKTGFLVEAEAEAFCEKMEYLVENPQKVREMGEKAREHSKRYSWERFAEKLDESVENI